MRKTTNKVVGDSVWPPDYVRNLGIYWVSAKGTGKSTGLGRWIAKQDLFRGVPQVVIDPIGATIDNLLDCVLRLPVEKQALLWRRIVYVDMGASDYVVPVPLYHRLSANDSLNQIAQRPLDVMRILDPRLQDASVEGWNALATCGGHVGVILAGLGAQVTEAESLIMNTKKWQNALNAFVQRVPDAIPSVNWLLREAPNKNAATQSRRLTSFLQKIAFFNREPAMRAMFGAGEPGIDWHQVWQEGSTVLIDFRSVVELEQRAWCMAWMLWTVLSFIKHKGKGRHKPFALMIDEISILTMIGRVLQSDLFAKVLDELLQGWARQGNNWITICHQEPWQVSEEMFRVLMACGTRIIGRVSDSKSALMLAEELLPADPNRIKRYEPVFGVGAEVIHERPVDYTMDEQRHLASQLYRSLGRFQFLVKSVDEESGADRQLRPLNLANLVPSSWPDEERISQVRAMLRRKSGKDVKELLKEIEARYSQFTTATETSSLTKPTSPVATIKSSNLDADGFVRQVEGDLDEST